MAELKRVLVTGATGNVGGQVVAQLRGTGVAVRALARKPESADLPEGVEVVRGDLGDASTLDAALEGVDAVFLVWPFFTTEAAPAVLEAIGRHARRVVYLSASGVRDDGSTDGEGIVFHAEMERLIKGSDLEWTMLRPAGFATNALMWAPQTREGDVVRWIYGDARRSLIHEADIAAVAVRALTEDGHHGARYHLTGPEALTQVEQVEAIGKAVGRPVRWEEMSRVAAREYLLAHGWPEAFVTGALDAWAGLVDHPEPVTSTVEQVTGVPARTFHQWAVDHAADFR
ncbi:Uncharacterized conserved protein YbjT, contains NAD(P)-binding and DUF2867 domains [Streptoalloteichus tenebrarius]|uniref:Uncharacterized conserved protein YbjT, contains NAD(P)-binding and DUF2867 domains n=1 Tax=Streptoalloteichus tenebrarius (strain ATCC 17920 / DSM 40477 / JCM 4838 / CBS 697.72 / NBRC 16177 / NCIMB 11028 / NRRL B-12390 / A12253. 1 / ISP 5477) TaxID=1933 RepID=A0ABT1HWT5_STRSD|nr:NAD(P)H-binding protein [Streptoalloteichus tenebrarius]MCP2259992.1 Uncharacterized conserved protein YbjT, contains NAD(P)-binding and DUF2867 domains [Streptoalloteichus tenebrarius]BFF03895.1 NAD(P)H-binding protein [Streptoalloteichus tenebrarius]